MLTPSQQKKGHELWLETSREEWAAWYAACLTKDIQTKGKRKSNLTMR